MFPVFKQAYPDIFLKDVHSSETNANLRQILEIESISPI